MSPYRSPRGCVDIRIQGWRVWECGPAWLFLCQVPGNPEVHLQIKGAGDRFMVTDGVHHVADVAPQRQGEVGGRQPWGTGVSVGLPLQPPQDTVSPRRLAFFLTGGGGEEEWGEKKCYFCLLFYSITILSKHCKFYLNFNNNAVF